MGFQIPHSRNDSQKKNTQGLYEGCKKIELLFQNKEIITPKPTKQTKPNENVQWIL